MDSFESLAVMPFTWVHSSTLIHISPFLFYRKLQVGIYGYVTSCEVCLPEKWCCLNSSVSVTLQSQQAWPESQDFFDTGFGGTSAALFKAVSTSDICSAARWSSMHCICFHHVDMEALSKTHTGPDKSKTEEVCLHCGGMNLLTLPSGCLCNIYLLLAEAQKWRNTALGCIKTLPF